MTHMYRVEYTELCEISVPKIKVPLYVIDIIHQEVLLWKQKQEIKLSSWKCNNEIIFDA